MQLGDHHKCRQRAAYCFQRAALSNSLLAREKLANVAETWIKLAIQLEEQLHRAFELLSEAEKPLDPIEGPEAELLSEQVSECANGVDLLISVDA